ncbi:MAG: hypothetical protein MJ210_01280 [Alphaproteobacteria bacterium]|nr:hypothetical protein [Alphaproteobacteria bacterium]
MFEQYIPELQPSIKEYNDYIRANKISKTSEERLVDFLYLISKSYLWNSDKNEYEFTKPDISRSLKEKTEASYNKLDSVVSVLAHRLRIRPMKDCIEGISSIVKDEMYNLPEGCQRDTSSSWFYKMFPAQEQMFNNVRYEMVRYGLNVKPSIGLFKKLDDLCLKYDAYEYKVINEQNYNQRQDPIIIYAKKENQSQMQKDLADVIASYRRSDEYEAFGYKNLGNGVFAADEIKCEDVATLQMQLLDAKEKEVFEHPDPDEFVQDDKEFELEKSIKAKKDFRSEIYKYLRRHKYDRSMSNAQFQICKMLVTVYKNCKGNNRVRPSAKTM